MKKTFIRNSILVLTLLFALIITVTISYNYISTQIINQNVNANLEKIIETTSTSVIQEFSNDYNRIDTKIKAVVNDYPTYDNLARVNAKLNDLAPYKDEILFTSDIRCGFGGFVEDNAKGDYYLINGITYQDQHQADLNKDKEFNVVIADLGNNYVTDSGQVNEFSGNDSIYIIYQFGDIIVYANANDILKYSFQDLEMISDYFIIKIDGGIRYSTCVDKPTMLYNYLSDQGNSSYAIEYKLYNILKEIKSSTDYRLINDMRYQDDKCWILASSLNSPSCTNDLFLIMPINEFYSVSAIRTVFAPLLATFFVVLIIVALALVISYYMIYRKNNDINNVLHKQGKDPIYQLKIKNNGDIVSFNSPFKDILKDYKSYKNFKDFTFLESYDEFIPSLANQKPFTISLSQEELNNALPMFLRCTILKYWRYYIVVCLNATEIESKTFRYRTAAIYDDVTNNPREEILKEDIEAAINEIKTGKASGKMSLLEVNAISYKNLSLFYGKYIGEQIQVKENETLKNFLSTKFIQYYTLTPEKTVLFVKQLDDYSEAEKIAKDIVNEFKKPLDIQGNSLVLEMNVAIYNLDLDMFPNDNPKQILDGLDRVTSRLETSRQKVVDSYNLSVEKFITSEEMLEADIRKAVANNEFAMYLQPQYNIFEHHIDSFELLIRWVNPKYINTSPAHFIEVAEKNGMILQIGKFVNEESMRIAKALEQYNLEFSLNVSPIQLLQAGFVAELNEVAERYQVDKTKIALEVTETFLMENFDLVVEKLNALKRDGFKVHLDDFGTGYSSMLYLKELPIDAIKIDKEFTKYVNTDKFSRNIVQKVTSLARGLDLGIICEGVEDEKQVAFLARNECTLIQGYLVSPAVPMDKAIELIEDYNINKTKVINRDKDDKKKKTK